MNRNDARTVPDQASPVLRRDAALEEQARELLQHLGTLHAAMKDFAELAREKLAALRRADADALQLCATREEELLREVFRGEQARKAVLARLAQSLHCPAPTQVRLSEIADRLPEPLASSVRARSVALKEATTDLQYKNKLAAAVARNLHAHIRGIFADVAGAARASLVYGPRGQHESGRPRCWVDAVG